MAEVVDNDSVIGSLNAHLDGEPTQAIVVTPAQQGIDIKTNVLSVMPHFYGQKIDCPYEFLHELCKLCSIQKRPQNTTEEDYRLRAIPFALKGEANTWLLRLLENSVWNWADFKLLFLVYFFPTNKTNALMKEILACKQEYDEPLSQYWSRFKGLLDACPNNRMCEAEIYNIFYEGVYPESKDLLNSSSCRNFTKKRVSEVREILGRLMDAKKAYDSPRTILRRGTLDIASVQSEDRMEARMDRLEKTFLTAMGKGNPSAQADKAKQLPGPEEGYQCYNT